MAVQLAAADAEALLSMLIGYGAGRSSVATSLAGAIAGASRGGPINGVAHDIMRREPVDGTAGVYGGQNIGSLGSTGLLDVVNNMRKAGVAEEYPHPLHTVAIDEVAPGVHNTGINYKVATEASRMQTLDEHNAALTAFIRPGMNQAQLAEAIVRGKELEQKMLPFWDDSKPREEYHPTSSAIQQIRLTPDGRIQVMWRPHESKSGKPSAPKWYTYKMHANPQEASMSMRKLLTSGSLGRSLMPGKGWFAQTEYDPSQAAGHGIKPTEGLPKTNNRSGFGRKMPYKVRHGSK